MNENQTLQSLEKILNNHASDAKLLPFREVCAYLNCSSSYLYKLTHKKAIPYYKPNGKKIYFKKSDLDKWLSRNRIKSLEEIELEAGNIVVNGRKKAS